MSYVFLNVLNMNITASVIIIAVILIRTIIGKLPKKFSYILWLIPAFRLICPVSVSSSLSVFNLFKPKVEQNRMEYIPENYNSVPVEYPSVVMPADTAVRNTAVSYAEHTDNNLSVTDIIVFIWFSVTVSILVYCIILYFRVYKRIKHSCKKEGYYVCADIDTPFVFGFLHPEIYVPDELSDSDLACVIAHEKVHIRRCDHIFKMLCVIITAVHWFNPLVWIACRLMTSDMEISCDEKALKNMKIEMKKTYAASLLNISMKQNKISLTGIIRFGESNIKRRIKYVLAIKKPDMTSIIFAVTVIIASFVTMLTNAETEIFNVTSELLSIDNKKRNSNNDNNYPYTSYKAIITTAKTDTDNFVNTLPISSTEPDTLSTENTAETQYTTELKCTETTVKPEEKPICGNETFPDYTAGEFKSILYNGACYSAFYDYRNRSNSAIYSIPEEEAGKKLYDGAISINEYAEEESVSDNYKPNGGIYNINGITDDFVIAVKFEGMNNYCIYTNYSYYPASVSDLINSFSFREKLCLASGYKHSAQRYYQNINDKGYYDFITEYYDVGVDFVLDMLIDNAGAPIDNQDYLRLESPDYSIKCCTPLSVNKYYGITDLNIYEKYGYISVGTYYFYIGREEAEKITGRIQNEYACCETLINNGVRQYMVTGKYEP